MIQEADQDLSKSTCGCESANGQGKWGHGLLAASPGGLAKKEMRKNQNLTGAIGK